MNHGITLPLTTIRLTCVAPAGFSVGTGYLFAFSFKEKTVHTIITNKHVIAGGHTLLGVARLFPRVNLDKFQSDGQVEGEISFPFSVNLNPDNYVQHPDPDIDLCAIYYDPVSATFPTGYTSKNVSLRNDWFVPPEERMSVRPIESVMMIGYPNGLWDETNNRPIAREALI